MYSSNQTGQTAFPQTTGQLLKYIAKKIPERVLKALPMTIAIGAISWLVHTYLLVVTNEGFNPDTWLGKNFLNVKGSFISSTLLWTMLGAIIPMMISFFRHGGNPIKSVQGIVKMPGDIIRKNKESNQLFLPVILISCSATLLFDKLLSGVAGLVAGGIMLSSLVAFMTGRGSIFIQVFRMVFSDVQTFILKKQRLRLDGDSIYMIIGSSGLVLVLFGAISALGVFPFIFGKLALMIPFMAGFFGIVLTGILFLFNSIWFILLILGIVLLMKNKNTPKQLMFFAVLFLAAMGANRLFGTQIFADDGGWSEAGGTFIGWVTSEGCIPAVLSGLPPAIGGLIGSYVSTILSGLFVGLGPMDLPVPPEPVVPGTPVPPTGPSVPVPPSGTDTTGPVTQTPPPQNPPLTDEEKQKQEQERLRQEQEAEKARQEFEKRRQEAIEIQRQEREKALKELERIRKEKEAKQKYIASLCAKYNTTPDKLRDVLKANIGANQADAAKWDAEARKWEMAETAATAILVAADTTIDGLANMTGPTGRGIRAGYKVIKGAASSMAENGINTTAAISGAVSGGADAATDFIDNPYKKAAVTIAGETLSGAIQDGAQGAKNGLIKGIYGAGSNALSDKLAGPGFGNDMVQTFNKNGTATVAVNSGGKWVTKTLSGSSAITFANKKIGQQLTQSTIKGAYGMGNELGVKPALQNQGILPK